MSRTDIQQNLLDAMQILSQQAANNTGADKTIKAVIKEIVDAGKNIYIIEYGGNKFEAGSFGSSYQIGDIVYVLIPQGDFSQTKVILGNAGSRSTLLQSGVEKAVYTSVANNLMMAGDIDLKSWVDETKDVPIQNSDFIKLFSTYIKDDERLFCFSAKVKTEIDITHRVNGNYGLRLSIPLKNPDTGASAPRMYVMDVNTMPGSPYYYDVYQTVKLYYTIPEDLEYDETQLPTLIAFVEGFGYGEVDTTDPVHAADRFDIHIKDIDLSIVNEFTNEAAEGYSLSLVSSNGNYFLQGDYGVDKTILPTLTFDGKETSLSSWSCYWLIEDAAVGPSSEGYIPEAGIGWRCINAKTNVSIDDTGREVYQYDTTSYSLVVTESDVPSKLRYRCLLVNSDNILSSIITLQNLKNDISIALTTSTGSATYVQRVGFVDLIARINYPDLIPAQERLYVVWQCIDAEGNMSTSFAEQYEIIKNCEKANDGWYEFEIKYPVELVDKLNVINCTFYCEKTFNQTTTNSVLGTASISVNTVEKLDYRVLINNSDIVYKYDSDGDSPLIAQYDGPISSRLEKTYPISFRLFKDNGLELTEEEYAATAYTWTVPKNSMINAEGTPSREDNNYYYFTGKGQNILVYTIPPVFDKSKNNNTIILTLDFAGNIVTESFTIKFLKDGESGTNGSKYSAIISLDGYGYGERDSDNNIRKYHALYLNQSGSWVWKYYNVSTKKLTGLSSPDFTFDVYKDGKNITSDLKSAAEGTYPRLNSFEWSWFDQGTGQNVNRTCFSISIWQTYKAYLGSGSSWNDNYTYTNILQISLKIEESAGNIKTIRAYYPIEITKVYQPLTASQISNDTWSVPDLIGGYSHVLYESSGKNPDWDSSTPFSCINTFEGNADPAQYHSYEWETSVNNNISRTSGENANIEPLPDYNSGNSANYVKVSISQSQSQYQALKDQVTNYADQIQSNEEKISSLTSLREAERNLVDNFENLNYNLYKNGDNILLLNYRNQGLQIVKNLESAIKDYYEYCVGVFKGDISIYNYISVYSQSLNNCGRAATALYGLLLPNEENFDNLINLSYYVIDLSEVETELKTRYGIGTFNQLNYYAEQWNQLINIKYTNIYNILREKRQQSPYGYIHQEALNQIKLISSNIINFGIDENLIYLIEHSDNTNNYVSLGNAVQAAIDRLKNKETRLADSYSGIMREVITPLQNTLFIYQQYDYRENYFDGLKEPYEQENENLNNNKNQLQKDIGNLEDGSTTATLTIVHVRPIIMLLNNTELSYLDDWDGNKLYTGDNDTYFFAPQIGAGVKNDNAFTGIIMGQRKVNSSNYVETGLFGYNNNIQSIFLNAEDGSAVFGRPGYNQITITSDKNEIYFKNTDGKMWSGNHSSMSGANGFYISSDGISVGYGFKAYSNGNLELGSSSTPTYIRLLHDSSEIYSGTHTTLTSGNTGFYLSNKGFSIQNLNGNGLYFDSTQGIMRLGYRASTDTSSNPSCWIINGNSTSSYIAYHTTALNYNYDSPTPFSDAATNQVYIGTNGIRLGNKFGVDNKGRLSGSDVKLSGVLESKSGNFVSKVGEGAFRTLYNDSEIVELGTQTWNNDSSKRGMALNAYSKNGSCKFIGFAKENPIYADSWGATLPSANTKALNSTFYLQNGNENYYYIYTCKGTDTPSVNHYWTGPTLYLKTEYAQPPTIHWLNSLVLNYGLNPNGIKQENIFYGDTNFQSDVYFKTVATFSSMPTFNGGITVNNAMATFNNGLEVNKAYASTFGSGEFVGGLFVKSTDSKYSIQFTNDGAINFVKENVAVLKAGMYSDSYSFYITTDSGGDIYIGDNLGLIPIYGDEAYRGLSKSIYVVTGIEVDEEGNIQEVGSYLNFCKGIYIGRSGTRVFPEG